MVEKQNTSLSKTLTVEKIIGASSHDTVKVL